MVSLLIAALDSIRTFIIGGFNAPQFISTAYHAVGIILENGQLVTVDPELESSWMRSMEIPNGRTEYDLIAWTLIVKNQQLFWHLLRTLHVVTVGPNRAFDSAVDRKRLDVPLDGS